jgi:nitrilase
MAASQDSFRIAAVQACPVYLDRDATIDKACSLIRQTGAEGSVLAVFPEAFVPGYPLWVWFIPPGHTAPLRRLYSILLENAITIPSDATDRLCDAARGVGVAVAIGVNERNTESSGSTLYNTLLYIGSDGAILGKHRKLVPTAGERLVWGQGDGSDLEVFDLSFGRLGGLLCWENYMPLARYAMCAWGTEIFVAPTWDRGEPWLSTMRHAAKEGRCVVVGCCSAMHKSDIPDQLAFKEEYLGAVAEWINPGLSVIVDPDGKYLAGPVENQEAILYADVTREMIMGPRFQLDAAGHYARPDVFEFRVNRNPRPFIEVVESDRAKDVSGVSSDVSEPEDGPPS